MGEGRLETSRVAFKGKNKRIKIDLKELIDFHTKTYQGSFLIFLYGLNDTKKNNGKRIVTLKIE